MEKEKRFDKLVYFFILFSPILDALTSIFVRNVDLPFSIGTIIRGIFLIFVLIWLKNNLNNKVLLIFILYVFLALMYYLSIFKLDAFYEINNIFQIFYLPIIMLFFSKYNNDKINDKLITIIYLVYLNLIIVPFLLKLGYSLNDSYSNKEGYFGLFIGGNEISAIIVGLSPIVLNYVNKSNNYILKIVTYIELFVVIYLVGTKTLFIGIILVFLYLLYRHLRYSYVVMNEKKNRIIPIIVITVLVGGCVLLPFSPMVKNLKTSFKYYNINSVKDVINVENIDNIIFSKRLSNISKVNREYTKSSAEGYIYGIGINNIKKINVIEIDLFDIFYSVGVFGFVIYILMVLYTSKFNALRDKYNFSMFLFIIMSIFSGHVLIKPMVSIYMGLLYLLSRNSISLNKKKILLVSNMYPDKKAPHYGIFVKNTEDLLRDNGFVVDKVIMTKKDNKLSKLVSYSLLHLRVILKGIINNYDYIYVHFISHSSLGACFVKKTSKNTCLVLNAHGNDVIADMNNEIKNENRSRKYLKYADKVVVPSKYFKDIISDKYGFDKDSIYVYPSGGVNTGTFMNIDRKNAIKNANLNSKYKYIGYVSRLAKDKGYDVFLKAIKYLKDQDLIKNEKFLVVGSGEEQEKFNELVKTLKIKDLLEVRSMVSPEELVNIYNSLDIFVFPTYRKSESLGLVGLEAMACETLIIASNNYGPTDYVKDGKNGLLFKSGDYEDLAKKIIKMEKMKSEEVKKIKAQARETAIKYDNINTKDLLLKVFK